MNEIIQVNGSLIMANQTKLGIIGGSGIYDIDGVEDGQWVTIRTLIRQTLQMIFSRAH